MRTAKKIQIIGKVQNVGFRYYTQKKAVELNLFGFVKNQQDGSVYVEVVGEETAIDEFIIWCHSGPQWTRVSEVQDQDIPMFEKSTFGIK